ncbi:MAG: ArsB/NhaD family transporter [Negativicutes bacterium]|nr:ArsB/NhaD family transporter [Negativicutes bacterium]
MAMICPIDQPLAAMIIFCLAYALIVWEKIHRTIVALAGAAAMLTVGIIDQHQAIHHIDFNTIGLLVGMMIIVTITGDSGLFRFLAIWTAKRVGGHPARLFVALSTLTAVGSAFLDNVTTVMLMVPVTVSIARQLKLKPIPYLIAQIIASNTGGTATLIGDPPNIMIGSAVNELTFMSFIENLALVSALIHAVTIACLLFVYRHSLVSEGHDPGMIMSLDERKQIKNPRLLKICLAVLALTIGLFFLHRTIQLETATCAMLGATLLMLLTQRGTETNLEHVFSRVEWVTLFFFVGLFVLVGGLVETGVISLLAERLIALTAGDTSATAMLILWLSAIASAFVDNIPFVATMIPLIKDLGTMGVANLEPLWWSLALGACLGGNGTLIGASANVVVAGLAAQEGYLITFRRYLAIGFPLMILSIIISTAYIYLRYL